MLSLTVIIKIQNKTEFKRNGLDLYYNKKTKLKDALCGFTFDITHSNTLSLSLFIGILLHLRITKEEEKRNCVMLARKPEIQGKNNLIFSD